jgi:hypothetical protein
MTPPVCVKNTPVPAAAVSLVFSFFSVINQLFSPIFHHNKAHKSFLKIFQKILDNPFAKW